MRVGLFVCVYVCSRPISGTAGPIWLKFFLLAPSWANLGFRPKKFRIRDPDFSSAKTAVPDQYGANKKISQIGPAVPEEIGHNHTDILLLIYRGSIHRVLTYFITKKRKKNVLDNLYYIATRCLYVCLYGVCMLAAYLLQNGWTDLAKLFLLAPSWSRDGFKPKKNPDLGFGYFYLYTLNIFW